MIVLFIRRPFYLSEDSIIYLKIVLFIWRLFCLSEDCVLYLKTILFIWRLYYSSEAYFIHLKIVIFTWRLFYSSTRLWYLYEDYFIYLKTVFFVFSWASHPVILGQYWLTEDYNPRLPANTNIFTATQDRHCNIQKTQFLGFMNLWNFLVLCIVGLLPLHTQLPPHHQHHHCHHNHKGNRSRLSCMKYPIPQGFSSFPLHTKSVTHSKEWWRILMVAD